MAKIIRKGTKNRNSHKGNKGKSKGKAKPKIQQFIGGSQQMFEKKQILDKQNKLRKLYEGLKRDPNAKVEHFDKIKFKQVLYERGEFIQIYSNTSEPYIVRLTEIIKVSSELQPRAFLEVQWVMRKADLPQHILNEHGKVISAAEVFPSSEKIYLYVESIKNKCTVIPIDQYGQLGQTNDCIFYTRANYDPATKTLNPEPAQWWSDWCFCRQANNPDLQYSSCGQCERWFHTTCVQSRIINEQFLCENCLKT